MPYTQTELKAFAITPSISACLSFLGSAAIIHSILANRRGSLRKVCNRVLLSMSFLDILQSINYGLSTIPSPRSSPFAWGAIGNTTTCEIQGFIAQLCFAIPYYNGALALYYLLKIRFNMKESHIRDKVEPFMHAFALLGNLGFAITSLCLNLYNSMGNFCYLAPYPLGCAQSDGIECTRGENALIFRWYFCGFWMISLFLFIPCSMASVFWTVWQQERKMKRRYGFLNQPNRSSGTEFTNGDQVRRNHSRLTRISERTNEVAKQGLAYVVAFFLTWMWSFILRLEDQVTGPPNSAFLIILAQIFNPLQGFLNYLVYIRPRVSRMRKQDPNVSFLQAIYAATLSNSAPSASARPAHSVFSFSRNDNGFSKRIRSSFLKSNSLPSYIRNSFKDSAKEQDKDGNERNGRMHIQDKEEPDLCSKEDVNTCDETKSLPLFLKDEKAMHIHE